MSQLLENVFADPKGFGIGPDGRYRYENPGFTAGTAEVGTVGVGWGGAGREQWQWSGEDARWQGSREGAGWWRSVTQRRAGKGRTGGGGSWGAEAGAARGWLRAAGCCWPGIQLRLPG